MSLSEDRIILVQSVDQVKKKRKRIGDIATWSQAYAILVAVLVSAEATTKEEAAGLLAHMQVVIQLCKDLGSLKWLQYDQQYREWAAASGKRVWGGSQPDHLWAVPLHTHSQASQRER